MNSKNKFTLKSSIIVAFPTLAIAPIPVFGFFLYTVPVMFIGSIFNGSKYTFLDNTSPLFAFPNLQGWMILISIWFIIGWFLGLRVYKVREKKSFKNNKLPNLGFSALFSVLFLQILVGLSFLILGVLFTKDF